MTRDTSCVESSALPSRRQSSLRQCSHSRSASSRSVSNLNTHGPPLNSHLIPVAGTHGDRWGWVDSLDEVASFYEARQFAFRCACSSS